nr:hypothetical protein [Hyphomonas sp. Mor2]
MKGTIFWVAILSAAGCATPYAEKRAITSCFTPGEREAMLALDIDAFDRTKGQGWRVVADRGCYSEAAQLIADYREQADDPSIAKSHQMQMHAAAEEREKAIILLNELIAADEAGAEWANLHYRRATRAFLANDLEELRTARAELAALATPSGFVEAVERFKREYPDFPPPRWPPNLDVVDAFISCFGDSYNTAYRGKACRDAGRESAYKN